MPSESPKRPDGRANGNAAGCLSMSPEELNRLEILARVLDRRLARAQAAEPLGLGVGQVERLCRKLRIEGLKLRIGRSEWTGFQEARPCEQPQTSQQAA